MIWEGSVHPGRVCFHRPAFARHVVARAGSADGRLCSGGAAEKLRGARCRVGMLWTGPHGLREAQHLRGAGRDSPETKRKLRRGGGGAALAGSRVEKSAGGQGAFQPGRPPGGHVMNQPQSQRPGLQRGPDHPPQA